MAYNHSHQADIHCYYSDHIGEAQLKSTSSAKLYEHSLSNTINERETPFTSHRHNVHH